MANVRLKVSVEKLIERIEEKKVEAVREHEKALRSFDKKRERHISRVGDALRSALVGLSHGEVPPTDNHYRNGRYMTALQVPFSGPELNEPSESNLAQFDKDIAFLKLSSADEISMSTDDRFARYL
jgi:hypothetical protein